MVMVHVLLDYPVWKQVLLQESISLDVAAAQFVHDNYRKGVGGSFFSQKSRGRRRNQDQLSVGFLPDKSGSNETVRQNGHSAVWVTTTQRSFHGVCVCV